MPLIAFHSRCHSHFDVCFFEFVSRFYELFMEKFTTVPSFKFTVSTENFREDIAELVSKIEPEWSKNKIQTEAMDGGIINRMYYCWDSSKPNDKLVVRIYLEFSRMTEDGKPNASFDRSREIRNLEKIRNLKLGPELVAVFTNGLCYKYLEGITLNCDSVCTREMIPRVTKLLATLNAQPTADWKTSWSLDSFSEFFAQFPPDLKDVDRTNRLLALIPDHDALNAEVERIKDLIPKDASYVYSHSDSKGENFIWNPETGELKLIDFEHSGMLTQPQEIAAHFVSFTDVRNPQPHRFPDRDFQVEWIKSYLEYYYEATGRNRDEVTDEDVERLRVDVNRMAQYCRYLVGVGCLSLVANGVFDAFEFCMLQITEYFENRSAVEAMIRP